MNPELSTLPAAIEIEYCLIGWVLSDNRLFGQIDIRPEDFYYLPHADAWWAMEKLFAKGEPLSPFTIAPLLVSRYQDDIRYLAMSVAASLTYPRPIEQAKHLVRLSQQRQLIEACEGIESLSPIEAASKLSKAADCIMDAAPLSEFEDNYAVTARIIDNLKDNRLPHLTGLKTLDEAMGGGMYPGRAYGFAARKKIGKTILAGTISHNLNMAGVKHLFICGEMSPEEVQQRVMARVTDSYPSSFRAEYGKTAAFGTKLAQAAHSMPRNVLYKNAPGLTFDELRAICASAIDRHNVKGIILDYWQLVGGKGKHQSSAEHLDDVAQWLADHGRKKGVWTVMMAQINQEGNTRGGEGIRLAFDQVYTLKAPNDDPSRSGRYLEMMETRYTPWMNIGSESADGLRLNEKGPFFEEIV
jgi:replicative DNA helicase